MRALKIFLILLSFSSFLFASGGNRTGTAGAQELLIPVGAKGISMVGAPISMVSGLDAIYYNPAGLSASEFQTEVLFTNMNYIADINMIYAGVGLKLGGLGSLAFTFRSLDFGDIIETTVANPEGTGATFSPSYVVIGLTYSNFLTDRIKAGVSFNLVSESIQNTNATGLSLDAGVQYSNLANFEGLSLGVVLRNFGPQMSFDGDDLLVSADQANSDRGPQLLKVDSEEFELPSQLEIGLAYTRDLAESFTTTVATSFQNNNFANDEFKLGAEVAYNDMFFVRGGYSIVQERSAVGDDDNIFGPAFGAGFKLKGDLNLQFDYAYRTVDLFDNNQVFSIQIGF